MISYNLSIWGTQDCHKSEAILACKMRSRPSWATMIPHQKQPNKKFETSWVAQK